MTKVGRNGQVSGGHTELYLGKQKKVPGREKEFWRGKGYRGINVMLGLQQLKNKLQVHDKLGAAQKKGTQCWDVQRNENTGISTRVEDRRGGTSNRIRKLING